MSAKYVEGQLNDPVQVTMTGSLQFSSKGLKLIAYLSFGAEMDVSSSVLFPLNGGKVFLRCRVRPGTFILFVLQFSS